MSKTDEEIQQEHAHRNSNGLTPAEQERFVKLNEELGESVQALCKLLLFGKKPLDRDGNLMFDNQGMVETELGDVLALIQLLVDEGDVDIQKILDQKVKKRSVIKDRLLHQTPDPVGTIHLHTWGRLFSTE